MGKAEGARRDWHGHVTAVSVAPDYRRLGLAKTMMDELERVTTAVYRGYFVDLYVRVSNEIAISMYEGMGYSVYRRVVEYYSANKPGEKDEDAFGELSRAVVLRDGGVGNGGGVGRDGMDGGLMSDRYEKAHEEG